MDRREEALARQGASAVAVDDGCTTMMSCGALRWIPSTASGCLCQAGRDTWAEVSPVRGVAVEPDFEHQSCHNSCGHPRVATSGIESEDSPSKWR